MKQFFLIILFSICSTLANAQNNVGIGTQSPHASAQLDVSSTTKGLLAPRMTTAQRNAIVSPTKGLLVYDTDVNSLFHFNGSAWTNLAGGGSAGVFVESNSNIYNSGNPTPKNFIFGANVLPVNGTNSEETLFFFNKAKGAFRAGRSFTNSWCDDSTGLFSFATGLLTKATGISSVAMVTGQATNNEAVAIGSGALASGFQSVGIGYATQATNFGSIAIGYDAKATAPRAFAAGGFAQANGDNSVALGSGRTYATHSMAVNTGMAEGNYSIAGGNGSKAIGSSSFSAGFMSVAIGDNSLAIGDQDSAIGLSSAALGRKNRAEGEYSFAACNNNVSLGQSSSSLGVSNVSIGLASFSSGTSSRSTGNYSMASGLGIVARGYSSTVVGCWNDSISSANPTFLPLTNPLFIVGDGSGNNTRSNALTVLRTGRISIGNIIPKSQLHIAGGINDWNKGLRLDNDLAGTEYGVILYDGEMKFRNFTPNSSFVFRNSANASIATLSSTGNLTISGTLTSSDVRLKKDITSIENSLDALSKLGGYQYHWKDDWRDQDLQTGLLAQEVEKVLPGLVKEDEQGFKAVNYTALIPYLLEAIKELKAEVDSLKKQK